eukprot:scaffold174744_cov28-Tisochrysis_lutea.AAC.5
MSIIRVVCARPTDASSPCDECAPQKPPPQSLAPGGASLSDEKASLNAWRMGRSRPVAFFSCAARSAVIAVTHPGVQKPHCDP